MSDRKRREVGDVERVVVLERGHCDGRCDLVVRLWGYGESDDEQMLTFEWKLSRFDRFMNIDGKKTRHKEEQWVLNIEYFIEIL